MYYAAGGSGDPYHLSLNAFTTLLDDCAIADSDSQYCKRSDCDTIFIVCNFQVRCMCVFGGWRACVWARVRPVPPHAPRDRPSSSPSRSVAPPQPDKKSAEAAVNVENAMMRYEFLEAIVRLGERRPVGWQSGGRVQGGAGRRAGPVSPRLPSARP